MPIESPSKYFKYIAYITQHNILFYHYFDFNNNYKKGYYNIEIIDDENYIYRIAYSEVFITILFGFQNVVDCVNITMKQVVKKRKEFLIVSEWRSVTSGW